MDSSSRVNGEQDNNTPAALKNSLGMTALKYAKTHSHALSVQLLKKHGATE
jgi:hypothetical protein